jgi:hypothetical protein
MHRFALPCVCGLALALVGACGGASPDNFTGTSTGPHPAGSGSGGSSGATSSNGGSGSSGGSSSGGSSSSGSGGGSSSSSSSSGGMGDDGGGLQGDDGGADGPTDGANQGGFLCKGTNATGTCQPSDTCCITTAALTGTQTATCKSDGSCSGTTLHCGQTADCQPMQVCCGTGTTNAFTLVTTYSDVSCQTDCPAAGVLSTTVHYQFCAPGGSDCPTGKTCTMSTGLTSYSVCL